MYIEGNDNRTPRERIDDSFLRRMLAENEKGRTAPRGEAGLGGQGGISCNPDHSSSDRCLLGFSLGMVYSPCQLWRNAYDEETALKRGTLFRELDMPWEVPAPASGKGGRCCE